ncbi:MAG: response regulator [Spirochaetota bacterium]|nr:response regulator [Spirochaetota bacterium]
MKKIIFVDDEINLLQGLKRSLRSKKGEWDMLFLESGKETLEVLKRSRYDIIVSDYRMPDINGIELLKVIKEKYPYMIRILLTGQSEAEIFEKAKDLVNVYLPKPCSAHDLILNIEKVI